VAVLPAREKDQGPAQEAAQVQALHAQEEAASLPVQNQIWGRNPRGRPLRRKCGCLDDSGPGVHRHRRLDEHWDYVNVWRMPTCIKVV